MERGPNTFNARGPGGYVAGAGRGAMGFTTGGDVGPGVVLRGRTDFGKAPSNYVPGAGRGAGGFGETKPRPEAENKEGGDYSESNFDRFGGFQGAIFDGGEYSSADKDADNIWESVEKSLGERRRRKPGVDNRNGAGDAAKKKQRVADQFVDLKKDLETVKYEDWDNIPEASTGIRSHKKQDGFIAMSDSLMVQKMSGNLNVERGRMIENQLDALGGGDTMAVEGSDYLKSLSGAEGGADMSQVGDLKKARLLFKSVTSTNPSHAPGWIAFARLEEVAGKLLEARRIISSGCTACPTNEDVWVEAARLNSASNARVILENALRNLPKSVSIWLKAADLESSSVERKKRVLRRALEEVPSSVKLWKASIELEEKQENAHLLLGRATECCPEAVDLWLALARLEDYDQARVVLNKARRKNPSDPRVYLAACALEEANGGGGVGVIVEKAVDVLSSRGNQTLSRKDWMKHAMSMEANGSLETCRAIIRCTLTLDLSEEDWKRTWLADAKGCEEEGALETARALYKEAVKRFPGQKGVLLHAISYESSRGSKDSLKSLLHDAVTLCPGAELFWLMAAKETWKSLGDVPGARDLLSRAFAAGHNSERLWLAAVRLEWDNNEMEKARKLLEKAREAIKSANIWMKSALLERLCGNKAKLDSLLEQACEWFPESPKLWMMRAESAGDGAKEIFLKGLKACPQSETLWVLAAEFEAKTNGIVKARSVLELGRLKNKKSPMLWLASVELEGKTPMAASLLAKALQECPKSGLLWAHVIRSAPRAELRAKSMDALENCEKDPLVMGAVADRFAKDRKLKAARKWYESAVTTDPDNGDNWCAYYAFELQQGSGLHEGVMKRIIEAQPKHGTRYW
eukprot:CAMPEP_0203754038 /NCGR_PEP_ID=MMETSP0098-20131031/7700_1 /ASSEMBLY_ACC=CAM_ASM_000208 /TAXON_ID=96639 /ORGANISM=" , Strain NY0313808BC1" /LENGTH=862 /DNA_ID=CAMNT_0050644885 /DNA_START=361 /DNA_END=2946 /DNA_ORIENTATION=-